MQLNSLIKSILLGLFLLSTALANPTEYAMTQLSSGRNGIIPLSLNTKFPVTLWRAIYRKDEMADEKTYYPTGSHPTDWRNAPGDFSAHGGLYAFADREEAMYWGNQYCLTQPCQEFVLVEMLYTPPKYPDVQTFHAADANWQNFLAANQPGSGKSLPARPAHAMIEGPLSQTIGGKEHQAISPVSRRPVWQYAIVHKEALPNIKVVGHKKYPRSPAWQNDPSRIPHAFAPDAVSAARWHHICPDCSIQ